MVVEQHSLCWTSGRLAPRRDGQEWAKEFRQLPNLRQATQGGGTGRAKGLKRLVNAERQQAGQTPVVAQDDHFHQCFAGRAAGRYGEDASQGGPVAGQGSQGRSPSGPQGAAHGETAGKGGGGQGVAARAERAYARRGRRRRKPGGRSKRRCACSRRRGPGTRGPRRRQPSRPPCPACPADKTRAGAQMMEGPDAHAAS